LKTEVIPGSQRLQVMLPEKVLDCESKLVEQDPVVLRGLPQDTSYGQRHYHAPDGFDTLMNVVLMGSDRTSIHKPQFCLIGAGWRIDKTEVTTIPIAKPRAYELPVIRLTTTKQVMVNGQEVTARGTYVYWFVADDQISADPSGMNRAWSIAKTLLTTGKLQRWAYVTCFSVCQPGRKTQCSTG